MTERSQFEVALLSVLCELYVLSEDGEENVQRSTLNAQRPTPNEKAKKGKAARKALKMLKGVNCK